MEVKKLAQYINYLWANTIAPSLRNLKDSQNKAIKKSTSDIVKAIKSSERDDIVPSDISGPIIRAIENKAIPSVDLNNIVSGLTNIKEGLNEVVRSVDNKDLNVNIGKTKVSVETKDVVKAIKSLEKSLQKSDISDAIDYTLLFDELITTVENKDYSESLRNIETILKSLLEKEIVPQELPIEDGRVSVILPDNQVARIVSHQSEYISDGAGRRINPATSDKQDEIIAALGGGKYTTRLDEGVTYVYVGKAVPGTLNSSPGWQIIRYTADFSEGIYADGNDSFDNIWDNRSSLSYS